MPSLPLRPNPYQLVSLPGHRCLAAAADAEALLARGVTLVGAGQYPHLRVLYRDWHRGGIRLDLCDVRSSEAPTPRVTYHPAWGLVQALARAHRVVARGD